MMQRFSPLVAAQIVAPSAGDWMFRVKFSNGAVVGRRVSPPSLTQEQATQRVLASFGRERAEVVDFDCWRDGEPRRIIHPTETA